jgi:hypothetical protein
MISAASTAANQVNSSASTGPRTAEGKNISSRNSLKHARPIRGLTSTRVVLSYESREEYDELNASIQAKYGPVTPQEVLELVQIKQHYWRLERCRHIEAEMLEIRLGTLKTGQGIDPKTNTNGDKGLSIYFQEDTGAFDKFRRYETAVERSYYRAVKQLEATQKARRQQEEKLHGARIDEPKAGRPIAERANGFVSQKPLTAPQHAAQTSPAASEIDTTGSVSQKLAAPPFEVREEIETARAMDQNNG